MPDRNQAGVPCLAGQLQAACRGQVIIRGFDYDAGDLSGFCRFLAGPKGGGLLVNHHHDRHVRLWQ